MALPKIQRPVFNESPFISIIILVVAIGLSSSAPSPIPIGLFSVVQFPNDACTTSSSVTGTCVTSTECTSKVDNTLPYFPSPSPLMVNNIILLIISFLYKGGSASGGCAAGFGVCCLITSATCTSSGTIIAQNNTYLQ